MKAINPEIRSVLPNSLKTELIITSNVREWRHFFKSRCSVATHPQMCELTQRFLNLCLSKSSILF